MHGILCSCSGSLTFMFDSGQKIYVFVVVQKLSSNFRVVGHIISLVELLVERLVLALGCVSSLAMQLLEPCKCVFI